MSTAVNYQTRKDEERVGQFEAKLGVFDSLIVHDVVDSLTTVVGTPRLLSLNESGKTIIVSKPAGASQITLPVVALATGARYTIILNAVVAQTLTITSGEAKIAGHAYTGPLAGSTITVATASTNILVGVNAVAGDRIDLYCNGSKWFASCFSGSNTAANSITFS